MTNTQLSHRRMGITAEGDALRLSTGRTVLQATVLAIGSTAIGFLGIYSDTMLLPAVGFGMAALLGAAVSTGLGRALVLDRRGIRWFRFDREGEHLAWAEVKSLEVERGRGDWIGGLRAELSGGGTRIVSLSLADPRSWTRLISQARSLDLLPDHVRLGPDIRSFREEVHKLPVNSPPHLPQGGSPAIQLRDGCLIADPPPRTAAQWLYAAVGVGTAAWIVTRWELWALGIPVAVGSLLGLLIRVRTRRRAWILVDRRGIAWGSDPGKSGYQLRWEEVLQIDMFRDSEVRNAAGSGGQRTTAVVEAEFADGNRERLISFTDQKAVDALGRTLRDVAEANWMPGSLRLGRGVIDPPRLPSHFAIRIGQRWR